MVCATRTLRSFCDARSALSRCVSTARSKSCANNSVNFVEKGFMTSEEFHQLIPAYLSGQLTAEDKASFESHLSRDPDLRIEVAELQSTWEKLGLLPEEQPSSAVRARFYQKLNDINHGRVQPFAGGFAW